MTGNGSHNGYRALAVAVLLQTLNDAESLALFHRDSARHFFTTPSPGLELWLGWLGLDQHAVVNAMRRRWRVPETEDEAESDPSEPGRTVLH